MRSISRHDDLRDRGQRVDDREQHADRRGIVDHPAEAFPQQLSVAVGGEVEEQAAVIAAAVMTMNARASRRRQGHMRRLRLRRGRPSRGAQQAKAIPHPIETSPGTTKAARQPRYFTMRPVRAPHRDAQIAGEPIDADHRSPGSRAAPASECRPDGRSMRRADQRQAAGELPGLRAARSAARRRRCRRRTPASSGADPTGRRGDPAAGSRGRT